MTAPTKYRLRPYQRSDVKKMRKEDSRGALNASTTGSGKTLLGVQTIWDGMVRDGTEHSDQVLIVAPLTTLDGWTRTVRAQTWEDLMFLGAPSTTPVHLHPEANQIQLNTGVPGWYLIGWEWFRMLSTQERNIFRHVRHVIFDEIHRASGRRSATANGGATISKAAHTLAKQVARNGGYRLGFSATPFGSKPEGAWSVAHILWPTDEYRLRFGAFWRWANRHLEQRDEFVGANRTPVRVLGKELSPGSIVGEFPCYIRHEAHTRCCKFHPEGLKADLPPRVIHRVPVQLSASQRKLYDQLEATMMAWIKERDWPIDSNGWPMVNALRMHQVCLAAPTTELKELLKKDAPPEQIVKVSYPLDTRSTKIDALLDILRDHDEEPFLVFTHATGLIPAIVNRIQMFGVARNMRGVKAWDGTVSMTERTRIKEQFLSGEVQIIVANIDAIAHGTDGLQTVCSNEVWISLDNKMISNVQAAGRLNRDGQQNPVNVWEIYADGTIELDQLQRLDDRALTMDETLTPRRNPKE